MAANADRRAGTTARNAGMGAAANFSTTIPTNPRLAYPPLRKTFADQICAVCRGNRGAIASSTDGSSTVFNRRFGTITSISATSAKVWAWFYIDFARFIIRRIFRRSTIARNFCAVSKIFAGVDLDRTMATVSGMAEADRSRALTINRATKTLGGFRAFGRVFGGARAPRF